MQTGVRNSKVSIIRGIARQCGATSSLSYYTLSFS